MKEEGKNHSKVFMEIANFIKESGRGQSSPDNSLISVLMVTVMCPCIDGNAHYYVPRIKHTVVQLIYLGILQKQMRIGITRAQRWGQAQL